LTGDPDFASRYRSHAICEFPFISYDSLAAAPRRFRPFVAADRLITHVIGETSQRDPIGDQQYVASLQLVGQGGRLLREEPLHPDWSRSAATGNAQPKAATTLLQLHAECVL